MKIKIKFIIFIFILAFSLILSNVASQNDKEKSSNNFNLGYLLLLFLIVILILTILVITENPLVEFLIDNYKLTILVVVLLFIFIYFASTPTLEPLTGFFVLRTTTTTVTTIPETKEIQTLSEILPGRMNTIQVTNKNIGITEINLEVYSKTKDVKIDVLKLNEKPSYVTRNISGIVYQYIVVEKKNLNDENIKLVKIKFRLEKSWIDSNNIDNLTVSLNRYQDETWVKLSTVKVSEDRDYIYYETETGSLSLFAITGSSESQTVTTTTTSTTIPGATTITISEDSHRLKWKEEIEKRGLRAIFNESMVKIEKGNIEIRFEEFIESNIDWSKIVETAEANKTAINEFLSKKNSKLRDFVWIESNDFLKRGKYKARIILPSTYRDIFVCEGTKDNPECSILQTCGSRPCYLQQYGKTHVLLDHFSGAGGGDSEALAQPYDCDDADVNCTETTVTLSYPDGSAMTINYQKPVNFFDETSNTYQQINQTITELPSNHPLYSYGYRYGTEKGIYKVYFKPDIGQAWEIGLNVSNIILRYDLQRTAYLDYSDMNYHILQTPSTDSVDLNVNEMNHTGVFTGVNFQYSYLPQKLKENLILNQTFRDNAPDPRNFGMNPATTYLIAESEFDYKDLTPYVDDTEQTGNFTTENKIEFKDALGHVKFFLPIGYAVDSQVNNLGIPNNTQKVRWRIEHRDGKHYLLYGVPVLWLNSAKYPVTIDPTGEIPFTQEIDYYPLQNDLNNYYFNATDAQQMTNDFQDYWSKNEICIGFYINTWHEYCTDAVDWTWYNSTDYSSYVNLTGVAEAFYGKDWYQKTSKYGVRATLEHYLASDSPEIRVNVKLENIGQNDISDTYLKIWMHDIRVNLTYDNDTFRVNTTSFWEVWAGWQQYFLDQSSLDLFYTENDLVSRKYSIFDNLTESWVEMEWNNSYWKNGISNSMNYNLTVKKGSEINAPIDLVLLTGSLNKNDVITTNFKWSDAIKQNSDEVNELFDKAVDTQKGWILDSYENGTEYYLRDLNMTIEMRPDKTIDITIKMFNFSELIKNSIRNAEAYSFVPYKFSCYDYSIGTYCPTDQISDKEITFRIANYTLQLPIRPVNFSFIPEYLLVNNETGVLTKYDTTFKFNGKYYDHSSLENEIYRISRIKFPHVFDLPIFEEENTELGVNFSVTDTSYCIDFPIERFSNLIINVTLPDAIKNYTFGRSEFIIENYSTGNSAIAHIRPYPCCGITKVSLQPGKVCSV
jgi:PGF-pre-PGF domain-containing protein